MLKLPNPETNLLPNLNNNSKEDLDPEDPTTEEAVVDTTAEEDVVDTTEETTMVDTTEEEEDSTEEDSVNPDLLPNKSILLIIFKPIKFSILVLTNFFFFFKRNYQPSTNTLYVTNLPFTLTNEQFSSVFSEAGVKPKSVKIIVKPNGKSKGYGFAEFENTADQQKALAASDKKNVQGREIVVKVALVPPVQPAQPAQPAQPTQTAQPVQPVQPVQPKPVQPAQPAQTTQQPAQAKPAQPAQPAQTAQPQAKSSPKQPEKKK